MILNGIWRLVAVFTIATSLLLTTPTWALSATYEPNYPERYMGGEATLTTAPNGAIIYDKALEAANATAYREPEVQYLGNGIWVIGGYSIVNCTVIEAPEGLIVYDTGESAEEGEVFREVIESQISTKPIKAIIYSHSHYALGAGAMVDDPESVTVIGHPKLNETVEENLQSGGAQSEIPELGPVLTARGVVQFNNYLPDEGPDAAIAARFILKPAAHLPVTHPVENGEELDVAGLKLQFFTENTSDDKSVTVWIPEKHAVLNNFFWDGTPNLYSLRGAVYRDPLSWRDGVKVIRDLQPIIYLINTHARPIVGQAEVAEALKNYIDLISLTYDQTLRGILQGLGPDELRYFIYKPKHLADAYYNAETYGETPWFSPAVFYYQMGWYDRDPTTLFQLPPQETAQRLVALMGGRDAVVAAARAALDNNEYAWAAQLVNYIYKIDPKDAEARTIRANALRKMGQLAMSGIGRAWFISEARALEGKERILKLVPPSPDIIAADPAVYVDYHRVRIDPRKAENIDTVIAFTFTDRDNQTVGLHVRRGVAEFLPDPANNSREPDIEVSMDSATWAKLYLNLTTLRLAVARGNAQMVKGELAEAIEILNLFDKFKVIRNFFTVPPLGQIHD